MSLALKVVIGLEPSVLREGMREPVTSTRCIPAVAGAAPSCAPATVALSAMPPANIKRTDRDNTFSAIIVVVPLCLRTPLVRPHAGELL
jgi:hypothetical protein